MEDYEEFDEEREYDDEFTLPRSKNKKRTQRNNKQSKKCKSQDNPIFIPSDPQQDYQTFIKLSDYINEVGASNVSDEIFKQWQTLAISPALCQYMYQLNRQKNQPTRPRKQEKSKSKRKKNKKKFYEDESSEDSDEYDSMFITESRMQIRENRKHTQTYNDFNYEDDISEEDEYFVKRNSKKSERIEHIFMSRIKDGEIQYLVRFKKAQEEICQWVPEYLFEMIPDSKSHLNRFIRHPISFENIPNIEANNIPIAHRRDNPNDKPELLFRLSYDDNILFYWEIPDDETLVKYNTSQIKYENARPQTPCDNYPDPNKNIFLNCPKQIQPHQVDGYHWLFDCWVNGNGSILTSEVKSDNSIELLTFLSYLVNCTEWKGPFLIVTSDIEYWRTLIKKWTNLTYVEYVGKSNSRKLIREYQFYSLDEYGKPQLDFYKFHILLSSSKLINNDSEFLRNIYWNVIAIDYNNKNDLILRQKYKQKIILTKPSTFSSLGDVYLLIQYVAPNETINEIELFRKDIKLNDFYNSESRLLISKHLFARINQRNTINEGNIALINLTEVQNDLIRLTKLHMLWRLNGRQNKKDIDLQIERQQILKICVHPFLIPGAEEFYQKKFDGLERIDLLLTVSTKFQWLDNVLKALQMRNCNVIIFSIKDEVLRLINEFCLLRNYETEMLIGNVNYDEVKSTFIQLISLRTNFEELNFNELSNYVIIIIDPKLKPQNYFKLQNLFDRIKNIDIYRLITYQTLEHEEFIQSEKKIELWQKILGLKDQVNDTKDDIVITNPPTIENNTNFDLDFKTELIPRICSLINDFSTNDIKIFEESLKNISEVVYQNDEEFIESFPVTDLNDIKNNYNELSFNFEMIYNIYKKLKLYGFGEWFKILSDLSLDGEVEIGMFCSIFVIFSFRSFKSCEMFNFPFLIKSLLQENEKFNIEQLICIDENSWEDLNFGHNEFMKEIASCIKAKNFIFQNAFEFLSILEMKLITKYWLQFNSKESFDINDLNPPVTQKDNNFFMSIVDNQEFNPFNPRIQAIINKFKADIIIQDKSNELTIHFDFWNPIEFNLIVSSCKNYLLDQNNPKLFHIKSLIVDKTTDEIKDFVESFYAIIVSYTKGFFSLPEMMHKIELAPDIFQNMKGFKTWKKVEVRTIREIKTRIEILHKIPEKIDSILNVEETAEWSDFHNKKYLTLLLEYGIDSMKTLLIDDRFGFSQFVSLTDMDYLSGKKKRRNLALSNLPEYLFDENLLLDYLNGQYQTNHQYNANGDAGDGGEMFEYDFRENLKKQENVPPNPQQNNSDHDISFDFEQAYDDDDKVFKL